MEKAEPNQFHALYEDEHEFGVRKEWFKKIFDGTMSYFDRLHPAFYAELVRAHITINALSLRQAEENIRTRHNQSRPQILQSRTTYQGDAIFMERAFIYVENIPKISDVMESYPGGFGHAMPSIHDAWWTLMLRMQVWNMGIKLVSREAVTASHHYYNDPTRVYIL